MKAGFFKKLGKGGLALVVLGVGIFGFIIINATAPRTEPEVAREQVWPVEAQTVVIESTRPRIDVFGEIVAGRSVDLRALVAGQIVWRADQLKEGGYVAKGEKLLEIDPFDYTSQVNDRAAQRDEAAARMEEFEARLRSTEIGLEQSRTQLALRQRDLERAQKLFSRGTVSQAYVDDRQFAYTSQAQAMEQAKSELEIQKARVEQQRATVRRLDVAVNQAKRNLQQTNLTAPYDAIVSGVQAELGKNVSPNDRIATLTDAAALEVRFTLSDQQYGRLIEKADGLKRGAPIDVSWRVGGTSINAAAAFDRVGARIAADTGGVELYAKLLVDAAETPLRPGAFVEVSLDDRLYDDVVVLPENALYNANQVYVINQDMRLQARTVAALRFTGTQVLVRGDLAAGDQVLTTRLAQVGSGVKVSLQSSAQDMIADPVSAQADAEQAAE